MADARWESLWHDLAAALQSRLPARWRRALATQRQRLYLRPGERECELLVGGEAGDSSLGAVPLGDDILGQQIVTRAGAANPPLPRWLLLDARLALRRVLLLPQAAEGRLQDVLRHEIDRQTPFTPEQVRYHGRVLERLPASQQIRVELVVLPRSRLEGITAGMGPLAHGLSGVDLREDDGRRLGLNLHERRAQPDRSRVFWLNLGLAAMALVLTALALLQMLDGRRQALAQWQARVAAAETEVREVRRLRNELDSGVLGQRFFARQRASRPTMVELLDDLSRRVPDDTSLDKLAVNDGRLTMVGSSRSAPALVGLLQESPWLKAPALAGAVQADPRNGRDRFTVMAELRGREAEAPQ
jgi:general secretion pathway protein L